MNSIPRQYDQKRLPIFNSVARGSAGFCAGLLCAVICFVASNEVFGQVKSSSKSDSVTAGGVARIHDKDFQRTQVDVQRSNQAAKPNAGENLGNLPSAKNSERAKIMEGASITQPAAVSERAAVSEGASKKELAPLEDVEALLPQTTRPLSIPPLSTPPLSTPTNPDVQTSLPPINDADSDIAASEASKQELDEEPTSTQEEGDTPQSVWSFQRMTDRKTLPSTIQMFVSIAAISLVPAILLMTTCFIRIVVVLGILRQAIGLQQLPPTQVTTALALMMTFLIMAPTWKQVKQNAIDPYSAEGSTMTWDDAWNAGITPIKKFMWSQISRAENENDFWVFYDYLPEEEKSKEPESFEEIPLKVLLPAFMISELKVAFLIGIQVLLPFLILDIVVASLCNTMGLIMLPPTVVSLPLKLLLFVMVDGWNLVVTMLLDSFAVF